jgi:peptidoglycan DL-endopeptidase CwlO
VPSTRKPIRAQLVVATGAALVLVLSTPVVSAQADPVYPSAGEVKAAQAAVGDKAVQIAGIEGQLAASNAHLAVVQSAAEVASERYNLARILLQERTDAAKAAADRATEAQKTADIASDKLGQFAAATYRQGGNLGQLEAFLSAKGPQDVLDRAAGIQLIGDIRSRIMQDADASSVVAGVLRRQAAQAQAEQLAAAQGAESARAQAQALVGVAAAQTASIQKQQGAMIAQLASLRSTSVALERQRQSGLKAEADRRAVAQAKAAAEARAAAQARADARARAAAQRSSAPSPASFGPVPSRGDVSAVINFAKAQLGDPYIWGAAGPSTWDCSGLTQMAWAQAGVSLSHYTDYQWAETSRVSRADLQPGDLVFFHNDGDTAPFFHHVGLYVGDGQMIEAPHTGAFVRYSGIDRVDTYGYGRP